MLNFRPKTEEEVLGLMPNGNYDFVVSEAIASSSQSTGEPMITIVLSIIYEGEEKKIKDFLLSSLLYKVKHFCESSGLEDKYNLGTLSAKDCVGKRGTAKVIISEDKTGKYRPQNKIVDYVVSQSITSSSALKVDPTLNDDVPSF